MLALPQLVEVLGVVIKISELTLRVVIEAGDMITELMLMLIEAGAMITELMLMFLKHTTGLGRDGSLTGGMPPAETRGAGPAGTGTGPVRPGTGAAPVVAMHGVILGWRRRQKYLNSSQTWGCTLTDAQSRSTSRAQTRRQTGRR